MKDRGYAKFKLFHDIVAAGPSYVCRLRDNSVYEIIADKPLTAADRAANVLSDQIALSSENKDRFGKSGNKATDQPNHTLRLVLVKIKPHVSKGKRCSLEGKTGGGSSGVDRDGVLRIATNLLDVPAEIIALLDATVGPSRSFINRPRRLPPVPTSLGLPPPAEPQPERHRDSTLLRDHRLPGDRPRDGPPADEAHA